MTRAAGPTGIPDVFYQLLHVGRRGIREMAGDKRYYKVDQHRNKAKAFRRDAQPPVGGSAPPEAPELELDDVKQHGQQADDHPTDRPFFVHAFIENPQDNRRKKRGGGESERQGHHRCHKVGRMDAEVTGHNYRDGRRPPAPPRVHRFRRYRA